MSGPGGRGRPGAPRGAAPPAVGLGSRGLPGPRGGVIRGQLGAVGPGRASPPLPPLRPFPVGLGRGRRDQISGIERRERDRLPQGQAAAAGRVERWRGPARAPCSRWWGRAGRRERTSVVRLGGRGHHLPAGSTRVSSGGRPTGWGALRKPSPGPVTALPKCDKRRQERTGLAPFLSCCGAAL